MKLHITISIFRYFFVVYIHTFIISVIYFLQSNTLPYIFDFSKWFTINQSVFLSLCFLFFTSPAPKLNIPCAEYLQGAFSFWGLKLAINVLGPKSAKLTGQRRYPDNLTSYFWIFFILFWMTVLHTRKVSCVLLLHTFDLIFFDITVFNIVQNDDFCFPSFSALFKKTIMKVCQTLSSVFAEYGKLWLRKLNVIGVPSLTNVTCFFRKFSVKSLFVRCSVKLLPVSTCICK